MINDALNQNTLFKKYFYEFNLIQDFHADDDDSSH
jgi:hypothetical protein